jgi:hypothetical protein
VISPFICQYSSSVMSPSSSQQGHVAVVRLLLARAVQINKSRMGGPTALHVASQKGHVEVVRLLLAHQHVEVNKGGSQGITACLFFRGRHGSVAGRGVARYTPLLVGSCVVVLILLIGEEQV